MFFFSAARACCSQISWNRQVISFVRLPTPVKLLCILIAQLFLVTSALCPSLPRPVTQPRLWALFREFEIQSTLKGSVLWDSWAFDVSSLFAFTTSPLAVPVEPLLGSLFMDSVESSIPTCAAAPECTYAVFQADIATPCIFFQLARTAIIDMLVSSSSRPWPSLWGVLRPLLPAFFAFACQNYPGSDPFWLKYQQTISL